MFEKKEATTIVNCNNGYNKFAEIKYGKRRNGIARIRYIYNKNAAPVNFLKL
jgi:hypothetical protein